MKWSVFKMGRGHWSRVEWLVDFDTRSEADGHAWLCNLRFYPEYLYWSQPKRLTY